MRLAPPVEVPWERAESRSVGVLSPAAPLQAPGANRQGVLRQSFPCSEPLLPSKSRAGGSVLARRANEKSSIIVRGASRSTRLYAERGVKFTRRSRPCACTRPALQKSLFQQAACRCVKVMHSFHSVQPFLRRRTGYAVYRRSASQKAFRCRLSAGGGRSPPPPSAWRGARHRGAFRPRLPAA